MPTKTNFGTELKSIVIIDDGSCAVGISTSNEVVHLSIVLEADAYFNERCEEVVDYSQKYIESVIDPQSKNATNNLEKGIALAWELSNTFVSETVFSSIF